MQIFERIYGFYRDLNPSTLTGAVDVVVVEDVATGKLTCSPFHVRFGKLQVLRPSEKKVDLEVNGRPVEEVSMKIGLAGETFFVLPVDGPVPSEYQTSPLPMPVAASAKDVPKITLAPRSPTKGHPEPLSDSELDTSRAEASSAGANDLEGGRRRPSRPSALSDSELESVGPAAGERLDGDEWTWKWGSLPQAKRDEEAQTDFVPDRSDVLSAHETPVKTDKFKKLEEDILGISHEHVSTPEPATDPPAAPLAELLLKRQTIELMYSRLEEVLEEGIDEVELCLFGFDRGLHVRPSELGQLKAVSETLKSIRWEDFEAQPDSVLKDSVICVFGPSTKCALFPSRSGVVPLLIGLRLYKRLFSLDRLLELMKEDLVAAQQATPQQQQNPKGEGILSWRQWWSSPRSQSSKAVPAHLPSTPGSTIGSTTSPTKSVPSASVAPPLESPTKPSALNAVASITAPGPGALPRAASTPNLTAESTSGVNYAKSLRLPSSELQKLCLAYGMNTITFSVVTSKNGKATCTARIFLWRSDDKIIISDIDGTITKSDALGHLFHIVGKDWTHMGVANLYTDIAKNGYRFLYLTSRPIGQATQTRGYLRGVEQDRYQLPEGPVIMSPDRFFMAMRREVIEGNPEQFKIPCLLDIRRLFTAVSGKSGNDPMALTEEERALPCPFYAGFGNRQTDAVSYQAVGINASRIYIINPAGDLSLQIITGYRSSYVKLVDLVDNVFPPINSAIERDRRTSLANAIKSEDRALSPLLSERAEEPEEFNDFFFWKQTLTQPDPASSYLASPMGSSDQLMLLHHQQQPSVTSTANTDGTGTSSSTEHQQMDLVLRTQGEDDVDDTSSERGDHYYFEEKDEAGLIPFA